MTERDERTQRLERLCRSADERARLGDPSRLFSLLALDRPPEHVRARLERRLEQGLGSRRRARRARFGSLAASIALAAVLGGYLATRPGPAGSGSPGIAAHALAAAEAAAAPAVELLASPGSTAQLLDLAVGETHVVMIFDEALDL
jgi:hypothetical protein